MAREPNLAMFCCESCGSRSKADPIMAKHLLPWKRKLAIDPHGRCRSCGGESWTIAVFYAWSGVDLDQSAIGLGLAAATGIGFVQESTVVNEAHYSNVPAHVVAELDQDPAVRLKRVAEFATAMERKKLEQRGGQECATCGMLFVKGDGKPWFEKGYCSKVCAVEKEGVSAPSFTAETEAANPRRAKAVRVQCAAGHDYDVPISFCGLARRCPECGMKTIVPEAGG